MKPKVPAGNQGITACKSRQERWKTFWGNRTTHYDRLAGGAAHWHFHNLGLALETIVFEQIGYAPNTVQIAPSGEWADPWMEHAEASSLFVDDY